MTALADLISDGKGDRHIANVLGVTRHQARSMIAAYRVEQAAFGSRDSSLSRYEVARAALAECYRVDDVKDIRDKAVAMEAYARQAKDSELIDYATDVRLRAERRAGELLREMAAGKERHSGHGDQKSGSLAATPKLADLGVTKTQSSRWQKLAELSDDQFEAKAAKAKRMAQAIVADDKTIIREARAEKQAEKQNRRAEREAALADKIVAMPSGRYGVIVCDDEWDHEVWSRKTGMDRHAANHYETASDAHTAAELHERTRGRFECAAPDCLLAMWTTNQHLAIAIDLLRLRGFRYVSNYVWGKDKVGLGYWNRNKHELMLLGVKGDVPCPAPGTQWDSLIVAPHGEHSAKPECFLEMLEAYFPHVPKIELNRRGPARPGWSCWGLEAEVASEEKENEAAAASGGAESSIGEPAEAPTLINIDQSETESDPVSPAGSPIDADRDIPDFLQRSADNRAPWMAEESDDVVP